LTDPFVQLPKYLLIRKDLSIYEKVVFAVLKDFAGAKNICWPSITTISEMAALSRPTVTKTLKKLEKRELIRTNRRKNHNQYTILDAKGYPLQQLKKEYADYKRWKKQS